MREPPNIPLDALRASLEAQYGIVGAAIEYLPRGADYEAGVYRVVGADGAAYLLKATARPLDEPTCRVPQYLNEQGIASVVAPLPTRDGALWTRLGTWTLLLYPFLDGETGWTTMTPDHWRATGATLRRIHEAPLPAEGFPMLRRETFDPSEYITWTRDFEATYLGASPTSGGSNTAGDDLCAALIAAWREHRPDIIATTAALAALGPILQARALPQVLCHADLHASNVLRDPAGGVHIIDWDEVTLAPRERDFIFVREPYAGAFWEGYGDVALDWMALTYFQWERVVQDTIACARDVCLRDDLGEGARAESLHIFADLHFAPGSNVDAAYAAAAHLASALMLATPRPPGSPS